MLVPLHSALSSACGESSALAALLSPLSLSLSPPSFHHDALLSGRRDAHQPRWHEAGDVRCHSVWREAASQRLPRFLSAPTPMSSSHPSPLAHAYTHSQPPLLDHGRPARLPGDEGAAHRGVTCVWKERKREREREGGKRAVRSTRPNHLGPQRLGRRGPDVAGAWGRCRCRAPSAGGLHADTGNLRMSRRACDLSHSPSHTHTPPPSFLLSSPSIHPRPPPPSAPHSAWAPSSP